MKSYFNDKKKLLITLLVSLFCSIYGIFISPQAFDTAVGKMTEHNFMLISGSVVFSILIFILLVSLFFINGKEENTKKRKLISLVFRVAVTIVLLVVCTLFISLISGIVAVVLNAALKNVLSLDQIKGVIDYTITAITVLTLPFFVSVFWAETRINDKFSKAFVKGVTLKGKAYLALLVLILILFAIGILISTVFNYMEESILQKVLKVLLLTITGTVGLFVSENICRQ